MLPHGKIYVEKIDLVVESENYNSTEKNLAIVENENRVCLTEIQKNEYK